jgi:hypothetical protein
MTYAAQPPPTQPPGWYPTTDAAVERWWDGSTWTPATRPTPSGGPGAQFGPPASPPAAADDRAPLLDWGIAVAGALLVLGAFLPWITISGLVSASKSGIDGDGAITAVLGVAAGVVGVRTAVTRKAHKWGYIAVLASGLIAGVIALVDYNDVQSRISDVNSRLVAGQVGVGLYLTGAAALALIGCAFAGLARPRRREA